MTLSEVITEPAMAATTVLAQAQDTGGQGEDFGKSSPVGLLLMIVFLIAVIVLIRSMTKHLKRLPQSFDQDGQAASDGESGGGSDGGSGGSPAAKAEAASATQGDKPRSDGS